MPHLTLPEAGMQASSPMHTSKPILEERIWKSWMLSTEANSQCVLRIFDDLPPPTTAVSAAAMPIEEAGASSIWPLALHSRWVRDSTAE